VFSNLLSLTYIILIIYLLFKLDFIRKTWKVSSVTSEFSSLFCLLQLILSHYYISYISYVFLRKISKISQCNIRMFFSILLSATSNFLLLYLHFKLVICPRNLKISRVTCEYCSRVCSFNLDYPIIKFNISVMYSCLKLEKLRG